MQTAFQVGKIVWRGYRYWNGLDLTFSGFLLGNVGWNTTFIPYRILAITDERIKIQLLPDSVNGKPATAEDKKPLYLKRLVMQHRGVQYHSRFHEYFYATKPTADPEQRASQVSATSVLNLPAIYTESDVRRAYKRLARTAHPDSGGSNAAFIELKRAHDEALRSAI